MNGHQKHYWNVVAQDVHQPVSCLLCDGCWRGGQCTTKMQAAPASSSRTSRRQTTAAGMYTPELNASEQKRMSSRQYTDGGSRRSVERGKVCLLQSIASVCLLLRHFIHVTDNFCHLFCPFSQVVQCSSPAAPDFLSPLSSHLSPLCSILFALLSPRLFSSFPLLVSR